MRQRKGFIVRQGSAARPSSVTDNLREHSKHHFITRDGIPLPLKLSVTKDGLTAKTGLAVKIFLPNQHIINPTS